MRPPQRLLFVLLLAVPGFARAASELVYIGTYTDRPGSVTHSQGIYALRFDSATGSLSTAVFADTARNPAFLVLSPDHRFLYVAGDDLPAPATGNTDGGVSAFAVDPATGGLRPLNHAETGGPATTHLAVDATGRMVIAVNYSGGYTCALPIRPDGSLGPESAFLPHHGPRGPSPRQATPHAHCVTLSPDNRFALVCDLGLDRVFVYRMDPAHAALTPNDPPFASVPAGAGARHGEFSPDGKYFYVLNEIGSSVCVFAYDAARGALELRQTLSTLPGDFHGPDTSAEIRVHPNGRFVYASNRGHDSLTVFARDPARGTLTVLQNLPCGGMHPRAFSLSPDGRWLLCANRDTDNVVVFRVDPATGRLAPNGVTAAIDQPVGVVFVN